MLKKNSNKVKEKMVSDSLCHFFSLCKKGILFIGLVIVFSVFALSGVYVSLVDEYQSIFYATEGIDTVSCVSLSPAAGSIERCGEKIRDPFAFVTTSSEKDERNEINDTTEERTVQDALTNGHTVLEDNSLVVVPLSRDSKTKEEKIEEIRKIFSDEVRVFQNEDGLSGIVQPVFRDTLGQEYLYVLVPVEE